MFGARYDRAHPKLAIYEGSRFDPYRSKQRRKVLKARLEVKSKTESSDCQSATELMYSFIIHGGFLKGNVAWSINAIAMIECIIRHGNTRFELGHDLNARNCSTERRLLLLVILKAWG